MRSRRLVTFCVGVIFSIALVLSLPGHAFRAGAQNPKPEATPPAKSGGQEVDPDDVISVDTTEVLLPVTVRDNEGQLVNNLTRQDFHVFEDGVEQPLSDLSLRQVPVDVVLMVDASSSVSDNLDDFRHAAEGFAQYLAPEDRFSLIQFDDRVQLLQDWTRSQSQLRRSLRRVAPGMFTRFNDAISLASKEQFQHSTTRRAIIVLTDGIDSGRGISYAAALRAALEAQTTIYVVANTEIERAHKESELDQLQGGGTSAVRFNQIRIDDLRMGLTILDASERQLAELTNSTGGRLYKPNSFSDLDKTYAEVANELRHQYALYYAPTNKNRDGRLRRVKVSTNDPSFRVAARVGYYVPKPGR